MAGELRPLCVYCEEVGCDLVLNFDDVDPGREEMPVCNDCLKLMFEKAFSPEGSETEGATVH